VLVGRDRDQRQVVVEGHPEARGEVEPAGAHLADGDRDATVAGVAGRGHHRRARLVPQPDEGQAGLLRDRMQQRAQLAADDAEHMPHLLAEQDADQRLGARELQCHFAQSSAVNPLALTMGVQRW
jgi:hypothetical protein